jgi:hypothetical protein
VHVVEGPERAGTLGAPPLADEAVSVLFDLTGIAVEEEYDERGSFAASTLRAAAETYRTLFTRFDARLRYLRGEQLSL